MPLTKYLEFSVGLGAENYVPEWLEAIAMRLLSKSANDRNQIAEEVIEALRPDNQRRQARPSSIPRRPIGKYIAAAAFASSLLFAGVLIVLELNKGTLTKESETDDVPIRIMQGDEVVRKLTVTKDAESVRIAAGLYVVAIDGTFSGLKVEGETVSLSRGSTETVRFVRSVATPTTELGGSTEMLGPAARPSELATPSPYQQQPGFNNPSPSPVPRSDFNPVARALAKLQAEFLELNAAYWKAVEEATDEVEMNRVRKEMNPREIMPAKYLAFEEEHRGTDSGLKALTELARMASHFINDPTSNVAKGREEAASRIL